MPDYKEMYLTLMRETEKAVRILIEAQQTCESIYIEEQEPLLYRFPVQGHPEE